MITPGQTLENPVTGERFTFTDTAASTGGELLAFDFALRPGGAVPIPHVHPIQTERFEVVAGRMRFRVGLRTVHRRARATSSRSRPASCTRFANAGDERGARARRGAPRAGDGGDVRRGRRDGPGRADDAPRAAAQPARPRRCSRARYDQEAHAPLHERRRPAAAARAARLPGAPPARWTGSRRSPEPDPRRRGNDDERNKHPRHPGARRHGQDRPPGCRAAAGAGRAGASRLALRPPPFDWEDRSTWSPALEGVRLGLRLLLPGPRGPRRGRDGRLVRRAGRGRAGVRRLVLLAGRGEPEAEQAEQAVRDVRRRADDRALDVVRAELQRGLPARSRR